MAAKPSIVQRIINVLIPEGDDEMAGKKNAAKATSEMKLVGFLAVSPTAASRMKTYPIIDGFDETQPLADVRAKAAQGDWRAYAVAVDEKGAVRLKALGKPKKG